MTYRVEVTTDGRWWMVGVPELDELTQARRLAEVETMAKEVIALRTGSLVEDIAVAISLRVEGIPDVMERLQQARSERAEAERLSAAAAEHSRSIVAELVRAEVPIRDIGEALGVSYQRVHQLAG